MNALSLSHAPQPSPERPLDQDLHGYLETCRDLVLDRLAQHLSPAQVVELTCVAGVRKFRNTLHDSLHILVDAALLPDASYVKRS